MRKMMTAAAAAVLALTMCTTAFAAGWVKDSNGAYKYQNADGSFVTASRTPDGYYCDENGYWNYSTNDYMAQYLFLGDRLFKTTDFSLSEDGKTYTVTADAYDTAFFNEAELKKMKKGDVVTLNGIGTELTVSSKQSTTRTDDRGVKKTTSKVIATDADGNKYYLMPTNTTECLAGTSDQYVLVLRPVTTGITFTIDTFHDPISVTGFRTTIQNLIESKTMYYKLHFVADGTADALWDSKKNYIGQKASSDEVTNISDIDEYYAQKRAEAAAAAAASSTDTATEAETAAE